jgi:serine/threonine protein phosphatase PrpC
MEISEAGWTVAGGRLVAAAGSVVGNRYRENYDVSHLDADRPLAVVADGMGDGRGSAIAGRTAVEVFVRGTAAAQGPAALRAAVSEAQREVRRAGRALPELTGCTLTAFVAADAGSAVGAGSAVDGGSAVGAGSAVDGGSAADAGSAVDAGSAADAGGAGDARSAGGASAWVVQIGDSRVYRLRGGLLELLTVDHTVAWTGVVHGWFAADSPEGRAARYRLNRYVGHPAEPEPDLLHVTLRPDDVYLLCTDGVADQVTFDVLGQALTTAAATVPAAATRTEAGAGTAGAGTATAGTAGAETATAGTGTAGAGTAAVGTAGTGTAAAVRALLDATLAAGGQDNATAVVIRVVA